MSRLIDADDLKQLHGMKDDCADCEKEIKGKVKSCEYDRVYTLMDFCGWIDDMPTIEPERKTGRWKFYGRETWVRDDGKPVFIQCSECNATVINNGSAEWNFCPVCGADMRGE